MPEGETRVKVVSVGPGRRRYAAFMGRDDATPEVLAENLARVADAAAEASGLLDMNLTPHNLADELLSRLRTIGEAADEARRVLVIYALDAGMSVRDTARAAGLATATVQRWKAQR